MTVESPDPTTASVPTRLIAEATVGSPTPPSARVYRLASAPRRRGIGQHDRVAVLCRNAAEVLEAHFGVPQLGAALVPINVRLSAEEIGSILGHSGARALILDHDLVAPVASVRAGLPDLELVVGVDLSSRHGGHAAPRSWARWSCAATT